LNYTAGSFEVTPLPSYMLTTSLAADAAGYAMTLGDFGNDTYGVYRMDTSLADHYVNLFNVTADAAPFLLNDNLYNIYLADNTTLTALDVYSDNDDGSASNTTLFTTRDGEYIRYAAVYNSGSSIKVYYVNNTDGATMWENGVFSNYGYWQDCVGVAVHGEDNLQMGKCKSTSCSDRQHGLMVESSTCVRTR
jgi:hypothetical protein